MYKAALASFLVMACLKVNEFSVDDIDNFKAVLILKHLELDLLFNQIPSDSLAL